MIDISRRELPEAQSIRSQEGRWLRHFGKLL
jgi:hypothetical protein